MKMIAPITVTDAVMASSNVTENDYPVWASGTTYALGARVIMTSTHSIYESVQASNTNHDPSADTTSTWWVRVGATNRWRAFDQRTGQSTTRAGTIDVSLTLPSICTAVALVGLSAGSVRVRVSDAGAVQIYDQTIQLVDRSPITSFFTYFTYAPEYSERVVFEDIPGYTGYTLRITIDAGVGTAEVGEIVVGKNSLFGRTIADTEIGFEDMSVRERDAWGSVFIVERDAYDTVTFKFAIPVGGEDQVRRAIREIRAKPAFFYADASLMNRGLAVYGLAKPLRIPLNSGGVSFATLETEELI
ncbi:hypothetical protein GCM10010991_07510 [Gemmobacter aquaticus]|uniref:Carbohydrate binding domain-containing protein n=1 Tax=Gemmobacter aquaticus TaxID=490185 RepID=A0A918DBS9_9RHOB|nr:hypothetical protein [Gemmobacter aquaticus]GGO26647.1 hypothetical protein GCM10010991_07510 [Gemmobacter aquaticus]